MASLYRITYQWTSVSGDSHRSVVHKTSSGDVRLYVGRSYGPAADVTVERRVRGEWTDVTEQYR